MAEAVMVMAHSGDVVDVMEVDPALVADIRTAAIIITIILTIPGDRHLQVGPLLPTLRFHFPSPSAVVREEEMAGQAEVHSTSTP